MSVTPLSADDWEILEQNANYLENNLLSQLRAAQKGQEIDVWVMGRTKIRIRVGKLLRSLCPLESTDPQMLPIPRPPHLLLFW